VTLDRRVDGRLAARHPRQRLADLGRARVLGQVPAGTCLQRVTQQLGSLDVFQAAR
jgi:hypothetical protein